MKTKPLTNQNGAGGGWELVIELSGCLATVVPINAINRFIHDVNFYTWY